MNEFLGRMLDKEDHCSCIKPPGVWSIHGCHWRENDAAYREAVILARWPPEWGGKVTDEELRARLALTKSELMRLHIQTLLHLRAEKRKWLESYDHQMIFVELCPRYVEASREAQKAKRASESAQTARQQAGVRLRG